MNVHALRRSLNLRLRTIALKPTHTSEDYTDVAILKDALLLIKNIRHMALVYSPATANDSSEMSDLRGLLTQYGYTWKTLLFDEEL